MKGEWFWAVYIAEEHYGQEGNPSGFSPSCQCTALPSKLYCISEKKQIKDISLEIQLGVRSLMEGLYLGSQGRWSPMH